MDTHPSRHDVIYSVLLAVLSFFSLIGVVTIWFISTGPALPAGSVLAFRLAIAINVCFLLLEVAVLLVRLAMPAQKWPTVVLNIVLLLSFPLGTALGIYGLWKVDRTPELETAAPSA